MPHTTDPAERAILALVQAALDDLARTVATLETVSDQFEMARLQYRHLETQRSFLARMARHHAGSVAFHDELDELLQLVDVAVPDYPATVDWDGEWTELNEGAA